MAQTEQIIIDVQFNVGETEQKLGSVTKQIKDLKDANREMKSQLKDSGADFAGLSSKIAANEAEIKSLSAAEKDLSGMISTATQQRRTYSDSFKGQAAQLADLKNQYQSLSKAERESAGGQEMLKHLGELDKQVKENDKSMGNFQRNVGNYPTVFDLSGTSVGRFSEGLKGLAATSGSAGGIVGTAFGAMKTQAISLGKAFLTPPIGLIVIVLSAIMFAVQKVVQAFKKNDEASENLKKAMSALTPVTQGISWVFDKLAVILSKLAIGFGKVVGAILSIIPGYKKSADAAKDLVQAQDELENTERKYVVNSAKRNAEIARIKKEAVKTDKYTAGERLRMLKQADDMEKQNLVESKAIAKEKLRIATETAKQQVDTSDGTMDKLAAANAEMSKSDEAYYSGTMRLESKATAARKEGSTQRGEITDEDIEKQNQAAATALEISRQLKDAQLQSRKEGIEKEVAIERENTTRQIEDIKLRLATESNLTEKAKSDLNDLMKQLQSNSDEKIKQLKAKNVEEENNKAIAAEQKRLELLLSVAEKGSQNELSLRFKVIENLRKQELANAKLTREEIDAINAKYDIQKEDAEKQKVERAYKLKKQIIDNEFANMRLGLEATFATQQEFANLELQQAQQQSEALLNLKAEEKKALYDTEAAYDAAVIESKSKVVKATQAVKDAEQKQFENEVAMLQGFGDAISSVLSEVAGDSKEAAVFQKLIALANVSLNLATAISAATAASAKGDPYTMALRIATNVASVIVAFSQVTKAINATKVPNPPKFAKGLEMGVVPGNPATGDSVMAYLTPGERVLNARQQENLFKLIAQGGNFNQQTFDYELLAKAISKQPAPVMVYKEFADFREKISTFDEHIKI